MKKHMQLKCYALSAILLLSASCEAAVNVVNNINVGRYLSTLEKPKNDQINLLNQQIQIKFSQNILTIKQAVQFLLRFRGYHLCDNDQLDEASMQMLNQPLPEVDREFGPMTLKQGLHTLSGNMFYLLVDPVNRLVGFKLKPVYSQLYQNTSINDLPYQE